MKTLLPVICASFLLMHYTSNKMCEAPLCNLHLPDEPLEPQTQAKVAYSIALFLHSNTYINGITIPELPDHVPNLLARYFISKGFARALSNQDAPTERSRLITSIYQQFVDYSATGKALPSSLDSIQERTQRVIDEVQQHVNKEDLDTAIELYSGAFTIMKKRNPNTYAVAVYWALSRPEVDTHTKSCFDTKCFDDCKSLLTDCAKRNHSCCCTAL